jgi:glutamyl-tRNA synthetase
MQERLQFVSEMATDGRLVLEDPTSYDEQGAKKNWKAESADLVRAYADRLEALEPFDVEATEAALRALAEARGVGAGKVIHPTRLAVTGRSAGPSLFDLLVVVGREAVVRRLRRAADVLG